MTQQETTHKTTEHNDMMQLCPHELHVVSVQEQRLAGSTLRLLKSTSTNNTMLARPLTHLQTHALTPLSQSAAPPPTSPAQSQCGCPCC